MVRLACLLRAFDCSFRRSFVTGQLTRIDARSALKVEPYTEAYVQEEFEYIANKLDISVETLWDLHKMEKNRMIDLLQLTKLCLEVFA